MTLIQQPKWSIGIHKNRIYVATYSPSGSYGNIYREDDNGNLAFCGVDQPSVVTSDRWPFLMSVDDDYLLTSRGSELYRTLVHG